MYLPSYAPPACADCATAPVGEVLVAPDPGWLIIPEPGVLLAGVEI